MNYKPYNPSPTCIAPAELQAGDLVAYLEGEASPTVVRHIAACPACLNEVTALRQMDQLLGQTLLQVKQPIRPAVSLPASVSKPQPTPDQKGLNPFFSLRFGSVLATALALTGIFFLVGLATSTYYLFGPGSYLSQIKQEEGLRATVVLVESLSRATTEVLQGAAVPDVNQQMIAYYTVEAQPPQDIVDALADIMQERIAPDFDRQLITELGLLDVSAVAYGGLKEERFEIAPPLELRRMLQQEFQERNNGLLRVGQYNAYNSYVVGEAGTVYKVWTDNRNGLTTLYFASSTDKGQIWSFESKIDERIGRMFNPRLAVDRDGYLYVMWRNWSNIKSNAFYFARSGDEGQTWSNRIRIDEIGGKNFGRPNLEINTDNGYLYITWENRRYTNTGIYVTHSADGGQTWSGKIRMANIGS